MRSFFETLIKNNIIINHNGTDALEYVGMAIIITPAVVNVSQYIQQQVKAAYQLISF